MAIIYKIRNKISGKCYIGETIIDKDNKGNKGNKGNIDKNLYYVALTRGMKNIIEDFIN